MQNRGSILMSIISKLTIALLGIVIALLIVFVFARIADESFTNGALGNLFATAIGLIIGIPIALEVNRIQEKERSKAEEKKDKRLKLERFQALFNRTREEINLNKQRLDRFKSALHKPRSYRETHWDWIIAISASFAFTTYEDYLVSGIQDQLPFEVDDAIHTAYSMLKGLQQRVTEAYAAEDYYSSGLSDQDEADKQIQFVKDLTRETDRRVSLCQDTINRYKGAILLSPTD